MSRMSTTPQSGMGSSQSGSSTSGIPANNEMYRQRIAMRAYEKWLRRGCKDGADRQDWLEAESEIMADMKRTNSGTSNYR